MRLIFALAVIPREKLRLILKSSGIKELKICSKNKLIVITVMVSQKNYEKTTTCSTQIYFALLIAK